MELKSIAKRRPREPRFLSIQSVLTVLFIAGFVLAKPAAQVRAQQVTNPFDPFASQAAIPSRASSKSHPRVAPTTPETVGTPQVQADNRPMLRPMEGFPPEGDSTRPGQPTQGVQQTSPQINQGQRPTYQEQPAYQAQQGVPGFADQNNPASSSTIERSELEPVIATDG